MEQHWVVSHAQVAQEGKINKAGEDALLVSKCKKCLGVFDGVGEWALHGVDSSQYSSKLASSAKAIFEKETLQDPEALMQRAYEDARGIVGTSTGCIVIVQGNKFRACNLGDSGFIIIRDQKVFASSRSQQVSWNCPFQMGTDSSHNPKDHGDSYSYDLKKNDIIVLATDGLWDNLSNPEIIALLKNVTAKSAETIVTKTRETMRSKNAQTPFSKDAKKNKMPWQGGKPDDVTVIVAQYT